MIRGMKLQLRALEKADLPFLHSLHNNSKTMGYFFEEPFETIRELEDLYEKHIHNQTERRFVLQVVNTGETVGVLSLIEIDEINRKCEIDIIVDERFQGKGYGRHGFVLGIKYACDVLNLKKVYLLLLPTNDAGMRIYKYAGFKKECRLKKEYFVNGSYWDVHRMCMFDHHWRRERERLRRDVGFDRDMSEFLPEDTYSHEEPSPMAANG
jgi:diamine N-acetyltransferase